MKLTGLHLLLSYRCTLECDHCFVWGSPWQSGVMTLKQIRKVVRQARTVPSVKEIYFEGGEPFLYYATLLAGVREAVGAGFRVGIVTNGFWATSVEDAVQYLSPFAGLLADLSVSSDSFHWTEEQTELADHARVAAEQLGLPVGTISIAQPAETAEQATGQLHPGQSAVMFRGRAAAKLSPQTAGRPWAQFNTCPHEDLNEPGRVHLDPFGNLHLCQGLVIGNLFRAAQPRDSRFASELAAICETYEPEQHPIVGPLLSGGPAALVSRYQPALAGDYADACHLCYTARLALRSRFPDDLGPGQMYGDMQGD